MKFSHNLFFIDVFADFVVLDVIQLDNNSFTTVKAFQFGGIGGDKIEIYLDGNEISTVEPQAFEGKLKTTE